MDLVLKKLPNGTLAPATEEDADKLKKLKLNSEIKASVSQMRNGKFFRKWWLLAQYAFDVWKDTMPAQQFHGQDIQPNFERFRKDLTILSGRYHPVFNFRGEMRVEADSLQWSKMTEESFEELYSATIDAVLGKILTHKGFTEEKLRNYVDNVMSFDR